MTELSDEKIQKIISQYKYHKDYNKKKYHEVCKHDETFMEKNRLRARKHYAEHKDKKIQYHNDNREICNYRSSFYYYKNRDRLDEFKTKHKVKYDALVSFGFLGLAEA